MIILGIDPGLTGAIARIDTSWAAAPRVEDMPTVQIGAAKGKVKREIDAAGLADVILGLILVNNGENAIAYIERQQAMPATRRNEEGELETNRGAASLFSIGVSYGMVRGVLGALRIPYTPVLPAVWKRAAKVGKDKEGARALAIATVPELSHRLARKKDHNRAEALLLAVYGGTVERIGRR